MVSRRKTTTPDESARQPAEAERAKNGGPAQPGTGAELVPAPATVNVEVNEAPAQPTRRRAPSRRAAKAAHEGQHQNSADHTALLQAVQALRQAVEANGQRLQALGQDSQETQIQLVQHTLLLNELVQRSQSEGQDEEDLWDRLAAASEEFSQASDRLLERMAEQMLRLEGKVDDMTARLAGLQRQLDATQLALHENRASLHTVRSETQAAAEQLGTVLRECQDTAEVLQVTRQEIRATKDEVEATSDVAMAAALQLEESRLRMREAQVTPAAESSAPPPPGNATNGKRGRLGTTVDAEALVVEVFPDSPAGAAGLKAGDRITAVDGQPIDKGADLPAIIAEAEAANEFTVEIQRGDATHLLTVRLPAEANAS